ncbi:MAG TPA: methyltransferase domain-containing protein [Planctomycetota bacterium]|jgi:ubiquinone/menaquinone biosynthesis C-methylase UbiE|nr:methyltransferase domain-containing protein [Planctomycetota bacterium]
MRRAALVALLAAACTAQHDAASSSANPVASAEGNVAAVDVAKINEKFRHVANVGEWVANFESNQREIAAQRLLIAAACELSPGMRIADVGAGTGLFEPLFSTRVGPTGRVFALEISPEFVEHLRQRAFLEALTNVDVVKCPDDATGLPPASVDVVFVCDVYHHFEQPQKNLASIFATLKPGGRFVVVDFDRVEGKSSDFVLKHVRAGREQFAKEITAAGFTLERGENAEESVKLVESWLAVFRRPAGR